jgi:hypothetical protein
MAPPRRGWWAAQPASPYPPGRASDRLVDLAVYRLYGLTEEEVAIVEGREVG